MVLSFEGYAGSVHCADSVCAGRICFCRRRVEASFAVACFVLRQPVRDTQGGREAGLPGAYRNDSGAWSDKMELPVKDFAGGSYAVGWPYLEVELSPI